jgi:hypothetical protein
MLPCHETKRSGGDDIAIEMRTLSMKGNGNNGGGRGKDDGEN